MSLDYTVVIPARLRSTRLPGKPLLAIAGKPMVQHVWEQARKSAASRVVIATDDASIFEACQAFGAEVLMTRVDHESGTDRLAEVATQLGLAADAIVVNVQGDEPLIAPQLINAVAALLAERQDASMGTAAHAISTLDELHNPNVVKVVLDARGLAHYFSRAPIPFAREHAQQDWWSGAALQANPNVAALQGFAPLRHIGIYSYRAQFLRQFPALVQAPTEVMEALEQLRALWHGHRIAVHIAASAPGPGVDTPEDLQRVRQLMAG